jgi:hypothetical protein
VCYITADILHEKSLVGGIWHATHFYCLSPVPETCNSVFRFLKDLLIVMYFLCEAMCRL